MESTNIYTYHSLSNITYGLIYILGLSITYLNGAIDDLYQKITQKLKLKLFFSIRSIRLTTVAMYIYWKIWNIIELVDSISRDGLDITYITKH